MNDSQKLLIIGLGKMGGSLLEGLISEKLPNTEISVIEPHLNETNKDLVVKNTNYYSSIDKVNSFDFDIVNQLFSFFNDCKYRPISKLNF